MPTAEHKRVSQVPAVEPNHRLSQSQKRFAEWTRNRMKFVNFSTCTDSGEGENSGKGLRCGVGRNGHAHTQHFRSSFQFSFFIQYFFSIRIRQRIDETHTHTHTHFRIHGLEKGVSENEAPGPVGAYTTTHNDTTSLMPNRIHRS